MRSPTTQTLTTEQWESIAEEVLFGDPLAPIPDVPTNPAGWAQRSLEQVAVLAAAAFAGSGEAPSDLGQRLAATGLAHCAAVRRSHRDDPKVGFTTSLASRSGGGGRLMSFLAGAAAAAALFWLTLLRPTQASLDELRAEVLAHDDTAVHAEWQAAGSVAAPRGDVVWSQRRQDGWLRFDGLPPLGPDQAYQLWIVDADRQGAPVDGGVFTIARGEGPEGEVLVPIHAKLPVGHPKAFVVTVEARQGVVVSSQEHVVAIASL